MQSENEGNTQPPKEELRLRHIMTRIKFDMYRQHAFNRAPELPPPELLSEDSLQKSLDALRETARQAQERNKELFETVQEELRKPRVCEKLGLWEKFGAKFHKTDPESWRVWVGGLECIGECECPEDWEDKPGVKPATAVEDFQPSRVVQEVVAGNLKKPCWGDKLIRKTWEQSLEETKVVPELGYPMLRGPFEIRDASEIKFGFRRFPREQKAGKIRMIDPAVSACECSLLRKIVPIPAAQDILISAAVARDPAVRGLNVVQHTRRVIKRCRKAEKRYEAQLLEFFQGKRDVIDSDLLKKGATQPARNACVEFNEGCEHVAKKRRREAGEKVDLEVVVVDVAKCYKNLMVKLDHRVYNRLIVYNPDAAKYFWFESVTAIFGSKHSVTGWARQGKFLRSVKRKLFGLNSDDYVDDFTSFVKRGLGKKTVECMLELLDALGLPAMVDKVDFGSELEVLGLMFSVEGDEPELFLTEAKREQIKSVCKRVQEEGRFELDELESFVGRLTFALSAIADRALTPVMRPLRRMLTKEETAVDFAVRCSLQAIESIMDMNIKKRISFEDPAAPNVLLYTDASWERNVGWFGAVLCINGKFFAVREKVTKSMLHSDYNTWAINFLETIAGVFAIKFFHKELKGRRFDHGIDNTCAQSAILNQGTSSSGQKWYLSRASSLYWCEAVRFGMRPWIVRVPSYFNIADYPTRTDLMLILDRLYPSFFTTFTEGFGLGDFYHSTLKGDSGDCMMQLARAFETAGYASDSSVES